MKLAKFFNHNFQNNDFKLYDKNNNIIYYEDSEGYWVKREYDRNNNKIYYEDSKGYIKDNRAPKEENICKDKIIEIDGKKYKLTEI